jgi:sulfane dehydrogenase subunit SoxC
MLIRGQIDREDTMTRERPLVAGNGLIDRRALLARGTLFAGAIGTGVGTSLTGAAAEPLSVPQWSKEPGSPFVGYGQPSKFEQNVARATFNPPNEPGSGVAFAPIHLLDGMITPNGLHFERSHSGIPEIDPDAHRLVIHGLVKRPLIFTLDTLARYPMESRITFLECGGNGNALYEQNPVDGTVQTLQGLVSCAEWTGVKLSTLLDEAGVDPRAQWLLAEGADAATMSRSIPMAKAMKDAMIALYQNGERLRPSNGYPMRLLVPGYEGNMNVKWLRRINLTERPTMTRDETSHYTMLLQDGKAWQFYFPQDVKSVITRPSPGLTMKVAGFHEISGLAWSGKGRVAKVEVSADGGRSWALAALQEPVLPIAVTRFRMAWQWNGGSATLQSRATDEEGNVQPTREKLIAERGNKAFYHCNSITTWGVSQTGEVKHVYG